MFSNKLGALLFFAALPAGAATIVSVTGTGSNHTNGSTDFIGAEYVSWTMGSTGYSDASILADLSCEFCFRSGGSVTAYLLDDGLFPNDLVDSTTINHISNSNPEFITLFTDETLDAHNTYYLVVVDNSLQAVSWEASQNPTVKTAPGVQNDTPDGTAFAFSWNAHSYAWDTTPYCGDNEKLLYEVVGSQTTAPEPGTAGLILIGLGAGYFFRRKR